MLLFSFMMLVLLFLLIGLFLAFGMLILKILYLCCVGIPIAVCLGVLGLVFCITVIGIPIGMLFFRAAGFALAPFR